MMDEDESFLDMLAKQEMNFMTALATRDEAPAWAQLQNTPPGITPAEHSDYSNMSVKAFADGKFPSPPALGNAEEVAQMMSESNNRDNFRPPSNLDLASNAAARINEMIGARPIQPGDEQVAIRRFRTSSGFASQRAPTQVQGVSMASDPFGDLKGARQSAGIPVGRGIPPFDSSFDRSISPTPSRVMSPGMPDFQDNESVAHANAQDNATLIYDVKRFQWEPPEPSPGHTGGAEPVYVHDRAALMRSVLGNTQRPKVTFDRTIRP